MTAARTAYLLLAAADTALAATGRRRERRLTKPLLMPVLAVGRDRPTTRALLLSAAGDTALLGRGDTAFRLGLASFLASHLAWVPALRARPGGGRLRRSPALAVPYVVAQVGLSALLWRRAGRDRLPVVVYGAALTAAALAALDTDDASATAGGVLFLASDTLLALERFDVLHLPAHDGLVMATYTAAQALLARGGTA